MSMNNNGASMRPKRNASEYLRSIAASILRKPSFNEAEA